MSVAPSVAHVNRDRQLLARSMRVEEDGFIDYKGRIEVPNSLLSVVLNN
jgi:hypothetical protein